MPWENVSLIEDDFDEMEDLDDVLSTSRGERRAPSRRGGDYRRFNRFTEDGYGDQDFFLMPKFHVYGAVTGTKYLGVFEAKTKDEAIKLAMPEAQICLCHQCDDECSDAEIHELIAEESK